MLSTGMGFLLRALVCLAAFIVLAGCVTKPKGPVTLEDQLAHPAAIKLVLVDNPGGLVVVEGVMSDEKTARFLIDTGATLTSIYPDLQSRLGLEFETQSAIRVHGMAEKKLFPATQISEMSFDGKVLPVHRVAVISRDNREETKNLNARDIDGILGMDILKRYHLFLSRSQDLVYLIPNSLGTAQVPAAWDIVELEGNPFLDDGRNLHFFQLRLGNGLTPALLDTGSQFNMMNWNTKRFPRLRSVKNKLRKQWVIAGAVGNFTPVSRVNANSSRAGQKYWSESKFLVLEFKSLDILGIEGQPFVISGMPMLSGNDVLIDFENDRLYFSPDERELQDGSAAQAN